MDAKDNPRNNTFGEGGRARKRQWNKQTIKKATEKVEWPFYTLIKHHNQPLKLTFLRKDNLPTVKNKMAAASTPVLANPEAVEEALGIIGNMKSLEEDEDMDNIFVEEMPPPDTNDELMSELNEEEEDSRSAQEEIMEQDVEDGLSCNEDQEAPKEDHKEFLSECEDTHAWKDEFEDVTSQAGDFMTPEEGAWKDESEDVAFQVRDFMTPEERASWNEAQRNLWRDRYPQMPENYNNGPSTPEIPVPQPSEYEYYEDQHGRHGVDGSQMLEDEEEAMSGGSRNSQTFEDENQESGVEDTEMWEYKEEVMSGSQEEPQTVEIMSGNEEEQTSEGDEEDNAMSSDEYPCTQDDLDQEKEEEIMSSNEEEQTSDGDDEDKGSSSNEYPRTPRDLDQEQEEEEALSGEDPETPNQDSDIGNNQGGLCSDKDVQDHENHEEGPQIEEAGEEEDYLSSHDDPQTPGQDTYVENKEKSPKASDHENKQSLEQEADKDVADNSPITPEDNYLIPDVKLSPEPKSDDEDAEGAAAPELVDLTSDSEDKDNNSWDPAENDHVPEPFIETDNEDEGDTILPNSGPEQTAPLALDSNLGNTTNPGLGEIGFTPCNQDFKG